MKKNLNQTYNLGQTVYSEKFTVYVIKFGSGHGNAYLSMRQYATLIHDLKITQLNDNCTQASFP